MSRSKVKGQGHRDKKNEKMRHFVRESSSGRGPHAAVFREWSSRAQTTTTVGKSADNV